MLLIVVHFGLPPCFDSVLELDDNDDNSMGLILLAGIAKKLNV